MMRARGMKKELVIGKPGWEICRIIASMAQFRHCGFCLISAV